MPTLAWIGKDKVINHHFDVPFRILDHKYSYGDAAGTADGNKIIKGDNLEALKALLPQYEGKIKCIYIDPPYNTGNEGWVYNDNVNDPKMKKWLGEVVGKEGEDLSRHDKWLCMMYPRLKLLQRLLSDDGAIFISIDSSEVASFKLVCDEVFGITNFIDIVSWFKKSSPSNDAQYFSNDIEYILIFAKNKAQWKPNRLQLNESQKKYYTNPDNDDRGVWNSATYTCNKSKAERPGLYYPIVNPNTGVEIWPKETAVWKYSKEVSEEHELAGLLYWGADGTSNFPRIKKFMSKHQGVVNRTLWHYDDVGHTQGATKELQDIFQGGSPFNTPKPSRLIERILQIATDEDSMVLDSFAGSGTTAHAVLNMNKQDGGNRKFILVEMEDYAETITAERIKRVIDGYSISTDQEEVVFNEPISLKNLASGQSLIDEANSAMEDAKISYDKIKKPKIIDNCLRVIGVKKAAENIEGTGGGFSYFELGEPLLLDGQYLNDAVPIEKIRAYIWYMETRKPLAVDSGAATGMTGDATGMAEPYYLGRANDTAYYFYYEKGKLTTLDMDFLATIKTTAEGYIIYADVCAIGDRDLARYGITFKKIPRDIARL